jgi:hypothetical protein
LKFYFVISFIDQNTLIDYYLTVIAVVDDLCAVIQCSIQGTRVGVKDGRAAHTQTSSLYKDSASLGTGTLLQVLLKDSESLYRIRKHQGFPSPQDA